MFLSNGRHILEMYWELMGIIDVIVYKEVLCTKFGDCFTVEVKVRFPERSNQHEYSQLNELSLLCV